MDHGQLDLPTKFALRAIYSTGDVEWPIETGEVQSVAGA
jgi:hypothetical protein